MFVVLCIVLLLFDQLAKYWIAQSMPYGAWIDIFPPVFKLAHEHNTGAAFSILQGHSEVLGYFALAIACLIIVIWWRTRGSSRLWRFCYALIVAGAVGNAIDRLRYGYVVDFLQLPYWPVFNVADCCLVLGCILLCWLLLTEVRQEEKRNKPGKMEERQNV